MRGWEKRECDEVYDAALGDPRPVLLPTPLRAASAESCGSCGCVSTGESFSGGSASARA